MTQKYKQLYTWAGAGITLLVLLLYSLTLSSRSFPGSSAQAIIEFSGMEGIEPLHHPYYCTIVQLFSILCPGSLAFCLNVFNMLCGVLSVWILFDFVFQIVHDRSNEEVRAHFSEERVQTLSAVAACLMFAFNRPVWMAFTRAGPEALSALLLLILMRLVLMYSERCTPWLVPLNFLLLGLFSVESSVVLAFSPCFFLYMLLYMLKNGLFASRSSRPVAGLSSQRFMTWILKLTGIFLIGLLPSGLFAWHYSTLPVAAWRDFESFGHVWLHFFKNHYLVVKGSMSNLGWLLGAITSVVPLMMIMFPKHGQRREQFFGSLAMHLLLLGLGVAIFYDYRISPWAIFSPRILIMPYVFIAIWFGYVVGYWDIQLFHPHHSPHHSQVLLRSIRRKYGLSLSLLLIALGLGWRIAINVPACSGHQAHAMHQLSDDVLDHLEGRKWLIADGYLYQMLLIRSFERGVDLTLINPHYHLNIVSKRRVTSLFEDSRLKQMAMLGIHALLREWIRNDPELPKKMATLSDAWYIKESGEQHAFKILSIRDLWLNAGYRERPRAVLYLAEKEYSPEALAYGDTWRKYIFKDPNRLLNLIAARQVSKVLTDCGCYYEDFGKEDEAILAYERATQVFTNNLSAMMNLVALRHKKEQPCDELEKRIDTYVKSRKERMSIMDASLAFGRIRHPYASRDRGLMLLHMGQIEGGIQELEQARTFGIKDKRLDLELAKLYLHQHRTDMSEAKYKEVLKSDPDDPRALFGMLRIHIGQSEFDKARELIAKLDQQEVNYGAVRLNEALLEIVADNLNVARDILMKLSIKLPNLHKIWSLLAFIAHRENDMELLQKCQMQVTRMGADAPDELVMIMARIWMSRQKYDLAWELARIALKRMPQNEMALNMMLTIYYQRGSQDKAKQMAERLLRINPRNINANMYMGSVYQERKEYALAESFFRVCVEIMPSAINLGNLAYALVHNKKTEEALEIVRKALEMDEKNGNLWDTYGFALLEQGELKEAENALNNAHALLPDNLTIQFHQALLYFKKEDWTKAYELAEKLRDHMAELSPDINDQVRAIAREAKYKQP